MDSHHRARLTGVLDVEGLDALVATTTENLHYVTGFRSIAHALFRGLELYGVFTRRGVGLVIPFIDTTGVAADEIQVDRLACYGKFFFNYADDPGSIGRRVREWTRGRACWPTWAREGAGLASTRAGCSPPRGGRWRSGCRARRWSPPTSCSGARA